MKSREAIVTDMCYTNRADFEYIFDRPPDSKQLRREFDPLMMSSSLWQQMAKLFDTEILPFMTFNPSGKDNGN